MFCPKGKPESTYYNSIIIELIVKNWLFFVLFEKNVGTQTKNSKNVWKRTQFGPLYQCKRIHCRALQRVRNALSCIFGMARACRFKSKNYDYHLNSWIATTGIIGMYRSLAITLRDCLCFCTMMIRFWCVSECPEPFLEMKFFFS